MQAGDGAVRASVNRVVLVTASLKRKVRRRRSSTLRTSSSSLLEKKRSMKLR
jgi:hypothetical protein